MDYTMVLKAGIAIILIAYAINQSEAANMNEFKDAITEKSEEEAFAKLLNIESEAKSNIEKLMKNALPTIMSQISEVPDLSAACMGSMMKFIMGLKDMKLWAFQMADSNGIPIGGLLSGSSSGFGSYQQCLKVVIPQNTNKKGPPKTGQYCLANIRPPLPPREGRQELFKPIFRHINATFKSELMNYVSNKYFFGLYDSGLRVGLCVPSSCSQNELNEIFKFAFSNMGLNAVIESCEVNEGWNVNKLQITILVLLSFGILICLISTIIIEVNGYKYGKIAHSHENKSYLYRLFLALSLVDNFKSLMRTRASEKQSLDCMNGIRYLSCTWVLLGHTHIINDMRMFREMINLEHSLEEPLISIISNAFLSVESFLFVTSTLVSYTVVKSYDSNKNFNPIIAIARRVWRLLPGMILITGLVFLMPLITSGPIYRNKIDTEIDNCLQNWWTNFIFIGNFVPLNFACMGHFWYISVDMQLFLVSIVYFLLLFRNKYYGNIFLVICAATSVIASGTVTYVMKYPPAALIKYANMKATMKYAGHVYLQPHVHLGVYCVGLFLGTYLVRNPKIKLSLWTSFVGWIMATCSALTIVNAIYPWNNKGDYTMVESIIYSATQRTSFAVCLAWLVLACYAGKAGYVNKILSWPGFQPLVKISYMAYLVHMLVLFWYQFSRQGSQDYSHSTHVFIFFGLLWTSHILAVILRLFYEAPCVEIERLFCDWFFSKKSNVNIKDSTEKPNEPSEYKLENGEKKNTTDNGNEITSFRL